MNKFMDFFIVTMALCCMVSMIVVTGILVKIVWCG